jgi:hypothetical protein
MFLVVPAVASHTLPQNLRTTLAFRLTNLDGLFWDQATSRYGIRANSEKRDQQLASLVAQDGWVIEGVYYQWLAPSFKAADVVFALTPSIWIRHRRVQTFQPAQQGSLQTRIICRSLAFASLESCFRCQQSRASS